MKIRRLYIPVLCLWLTAGALHGVAANEGGRSHTIVYINGAKYYVHTVKAGETPYSLSKMYGVDLDIITNHNPSVADGLKVDQTLKIPVTHQMQSVEKKRKKRDFEYHTVAAGETLYSISRLYAVSIDTILADNADIDPTHISIGTRLYIRRSEMGQAPEKQVKVSFENVENEHGVKLEYYLLDEDHDMQLIREEIFTSNFFAAYVTMSLNSTYLLKIVKL